MGTIDTHPGPLGDQTGIVNSQLVNLAPMQSYNPLTFGRAYVPVGAWPRQGVYNVPPVLPSAALQSSMAPTAYGGTGSYGITPSAMSPHGSPFSLKHSPLWWGIGFLIVGILMLQYIHYK